MKSKRLIEAHRSNVYESIRLARAAWRLAQYEKKLDRGRGIYADNIEMALREAWYYICEARRWKREMLALVAKSRSRAAVVENSGDV